MSENEMYAPRVGDVVEVTLRGRVRGFSGGGFLVVSKAGEQGGAEGSFVRPSDGQVVSVVKVPDPIPTAPDTVIWCHGQAWQRKQTHWWEPGCHVGQPPSVIQQLADKYGYDVLRTP